MKKESLSRNIWGLGILILGIGFLLDALKVIEFDNVAATWWPLLIIIGGIGALIGNPRHYIFPLGFILVGTLLQLNTLDIIDVNIGSLVWPIIVIVVGLSLLLKQGVGRPVESNEKKTDLFAAMAGIDTRVTSADYQGGKASATLGGIALDLRKATIKNEAKLELFTFMGGIEIKVPENWRVNVAGTPLMGGWENKTVKPDDKKAPVLHINATCIMGGVEIKN